MPYADLAKGRIRKKQYYRQNKDRIKANVAARRAKAAEGGKDLNREWRAKLKDQVFQMYGGWRCACCGETTPAFLQLDHINGRGTEERRSKGIGAFQIYSKIRKQGFPSGYRVLCANCNFGRHICGGICPHEQARRAES